MENKLKQMLGLLTRVSSNDVLSMPFKVPDGNTYTIEYYKIMRGIGDSLSKATRWRVTDHNTQVTFAPSSIAEMLVILDKLDADLNVVYKIVEHHLIMTVGWHTYCIDIIKQSMGETYLEECARRKAKILEGVADIVKDMNDGKDVSDRLQEALMTGKLTEIPKLTLVERDDNE